MYPQKPKAIFLDCDNTLVHTEPLHEEVLIELLTEILGDDKTRSLDLSKYGSLRLAEILKMIEEEAGIKFPDDIVRQYNQRLQSKDIPIIAGAEQTLQIAAQNTRICIISNGERGNVLHALNGTGLMRYFSEEHIFSGEAVTNPKPAPDLLLHAANKMKVDPCNVLVIGDGATDAGAAKAAGMRMWGMCAVHPDPYNHAQKLKDLGAERIFFKMTGLNTELEGLFTPPALMLDNLG